MNRIRKISSLGLTAALTAPIAFAMMFALSPAAYAGTTSSSAASGSTLQMRNMSVTLDKKTVSQPKGFTYNGTSYMSAWYVMRALDTLHVVSAWNGSEWRVTLPADMKVDYSNIDVGTGNVSIYINDKLVKKINGKVAVDPASNKPTTYLPIWYAMHLFDRIGVTTTWDGLHWDMTYTPPALPSPPDTNLQAANIPGAVSKEQLVSDLVAALGASTTAPATSAYDDVPTTDAHLTAVSTAVNKHWVSAFSSSHFGAGDAITLADAEKFYWNYLNIQQSQYQPEQTIDGWAQFLGLVNGVSAGTTVSAKDGSTKGPYLLSADEQQFIKNLSVRVKGYVQDGSGYELRYTPEDEYAATFAGGSSYFPTTSDVQDAITRTYNFFDGIHATMQGDSMILTLPQSTDGQWFAYATTTNDIQYSLDGYTWTSAPYFDATTVGYQTGQVQLKVNSTDGVTITFNRMIPAYKGSVLLGAVNVYSDGTGFHVSRVGF